MMKTKNNQFTKLILDIENQTFTGGFAKNIKIIKYVILGLTSFKRIESHQLSLMKLIG